jgi:hypothetical protein
MCSRVTPGAVIEERDARPVTSTRPTSVMMRRTPSGLTHRAVNEVHGTARALDHYAGDHPIVQVSGGRDREGAEPPDRAVLVAARRHRVRRGRGPVGTSLHEYRFDEL